MRIAALTFSTLGAIMFAITTGLNGDFNETAQWTFIAVLVATLTVNVDVEEVREYQKQQRHKKTVEKAIEAPKRVPHCTEHKKPLTHGYCPDCGFSPDMQSTYLAAVIDGQED